MSQMTQPTVSKHWKK